MDITYKIKVYWYLLKRGFKVFRTTFKFCPSKPLVRTIFIDMDIARRYPIICKYMYDSISKVSDIQFTTQDRLSIEGILRSHSKTSNHHTEYIAKKYLEGTLSVDDLIVWVSTLYIDCNKDKVRFYSSFRDMQFDYSDKKYKGLIEGIQYLITTSELFEG